MNIHYRKRINLFAFFTFLIFLLISGQSAAALLYSIDATTDELVVINSKTGGVSVIGSLGSDANDVDLAITRDGQLFGLNSSQSSGVHLWSIDRATGAITKSIEITGTNYAEGLATSGNRLKIGYSSGSNFSLSDSFADLATDGTISNSTSYTVTNTGVVLDFDSLTAGLEKDIFYVADARHPSGNVTSLITVDYANQAATAIGTYNFNDVAINDLVVLSDGIFGIDHANSVLHLINPSTGDLVKSIDLSNNGSYFGLAAEVPIPAAIWLFGGGLIGLIGIARRKKS